MKKTFQRLIKLLKFKRPIGIYYSKDTTLIVYINILGIYSIYANSLYPTLAKNKAKCISILLNSTDVQLEDIVHIISSDGYYKYKYKSLKEDIA